MTEIYANIRQLRRKAVGTISSSVWITIVTINLKEEERIKVIFLYLPDDTSKPCINKPCWNHDKI